MAKLDPRRVAGFLANPGACRAVLLHGDDLGLAREHAETLIRAVLSGAVDDPFRLSELTREEAARPGVLTGEVAALSMTGGRRVVRLREATDAHAGPLKEALAAGGTTLLVLEGGDLNGRSKLRLLAEESQDVQAIGCRRERPEELAATIGRLLQEQGVRADPPVLAWLAARLGEDRLLLRRAVEVLALHAGKDGRVDEAAALACIAEGPAADLDAALMAATAGDPAGADAALDAAFTEGASPVMVVRAVLRHVQRLQEAAAAGGDAGALRPPVFFRHRPAFDRSLALWPAAALEAQAASLLETERRTKTSAYREVDATLARAAIAALARQAGGGRRR